MPTQVVAYVCDHCPKKKRAYRRRGTAAAHEAACYFNLARRACATCRHYIPAELVHEETNYWEPQACAEDAFQKDPEETQLMSDCPSWAPKEPKR